MGTTGLGGETLTIPAIYGRFAIKYRIENWWRRRQDSKEYHILCKYFPPRKVAQMMIGNRYGVTPVRMVEEKNYIDGPMIKDEEGNDIEPLRILKKREDK